jgi:hypothetical protein
LDDIFATTKREQVGDILALFKMYNCFDEWTKQKAVNVLLRRKKSRDQEKTGNLVGLLAFSD